MGQLELDGTVASEKVDGKSVWSVYAEQYRKRYGCEPVRNAKVNAQCKALVDQLGDRAVDVVSYFMTRNDSFYVHTAHTLGCCLISAQKLMTEMVRGQIMTLTRARQLEQHDETDRAVREYLAQQEAISNGSETVFVAAIDPR